MKIEISVQKNGKVLAKEVIANPTAGEVEAAISRVYRARGDSLSPIFDFQIDVRQVE